MQSLMPLERAPPRPPGSRGSGCDQLAASLRPACDQLAAAGWRMANGEWNAYRAFSSAVHSPDGPEGRSLPSKRFGSAATNFFLMDVKPDAEYSCRVQGHFQFSSCIEHFMKSRNLIQYLWTAVFVSLLLAACRKVVTTHPNPEELRKERFGEHGEFLQNADRIQIYSIASTGPSQYPKEPPTKHEIHGFKIYGMTEIDDQSEINSVWSDVHHRIESTHATSYTYCFWPRHAIRAFRREDSRDYLICFECNQLYVFIDQSSAEHERIGLESAAGILKLNELLDQAKVPREQPKTDPTDKFE